MCICQSQLPNSSHTSPFSPWCSNICSPHLYLYFCFANKTIIPFLYSTYMLMLIYGICFSLSDWLFLCDHLDTSTSLQMIQFCSFLQLNNIPSYIGILSSLSILLLSNSRGPLDWRVLCGAQTPWFWGEYSAVVIILPFVDCLLTCGS